MNRVIYTLTREERNAIIDFQTRKWLDIISSEELPSSLKVTLLNDIQRYPISLKEVTLKSIHDWNSSYLTKKTYNILRRNNFVTVNDLLTANDFSLFNGIGVIYFTEMINILRGLGFSDSHIALLSEHNLCDADPGVAFKQLTRIFNIK